MSIRPGGPSKADLSGTYGRVGPGLLDPDLPTFARSSPSEVMTLATQNPAAGAAAPTTSASLYWPWRIKAASYLSTPLDQWYLYYTTDHGAGGVWLATGPTPEGPWTGRGRVYIDAVSGTQTETASVVWAEDEALFFMYYQQAGVSGAAGVQSTMLATSPDGVTWTRVGILLDVPAGGASLPGDGHTGYFRPFRIGKRWNAFHLLGGGNTPYFGLSQSHDGRTWFTGRTLGYNLDVVGDGRRIEWNSGDVVMWRGNPMWIGFTSDFVSGSTPRDGRLVTVPLTPDLRRPVGKPKPHLYPTAGTETTNYRAVQTVVADGRLSMLYQAGNVFYAASALAS